MTTLEQLKSKAFDIIKELDILRIQMDNKGKELEQIVGEINKQEKENVTKEDK